MSKASLSLGVMIATTVAVMTLFFLPLPVMQRIETATVQPGVLQQTCMLEGRVVQGEQWPVLAPVAGRVAQTYVSSGDEIRKGQLLIRMDTQAEERALAEVEKQLLLMKEGLSVLSTLPGMEKLNDIISVHQQKQALLTAIAGKCIRSDAEGTVENLYVSAGDLLPSGAVIGVVCSDEPRIAASMRETDGMSPLPGMAAWWCDENGTGLEPLVLESVGSPVVENGGVIYQLVFRKTDRKYASVNQKAPVRMILKNTPAAAVVPVEAIDRLSQIWLVKEGKAQPVKLGNLQSDDEHVLVDEQFLGMQVILNPDQLELYEGMQVRVEEGL